MADVIEYDALTRTFIERDFTTEEEQQRQADEELANKAAKAAKTQAILLQSAREKIAVTSGLTSDEMRALGFAD